MPATAIWAPTTNPGGGGSGVPFASIRAYTYPLFTGYSSRHISVTGCGALVPVPAPVGDITPPVPLEFAAVCAHVIVPPPQRFGTTEVTVKDVFGGVLKLGSETPATEMAVPSARPWIEFTIAVTTSLT